MTPRPHHAVGGGFKRSRALWERTRRRPTRGQADGNGGSSDTVTTMGYCFALLQAICYELQPIRWSVIRRSVLEWYQRHGKTIGRKAYLLFSRDVPLALSTIYRFLRQGTVRQWGILVAIGLYYFLVKWIHETLDAGPLMLIVTTLVIIFTMGLGDNQGGVSAYSVFNRGFEKLLGSIDADELLAQHVGGGGMGMNVMPQEGFRPRRVEDEDFVDNRAPQPRNNVAPHRRDIVNEGVVNQGIENVARRSGKKARRKNDVAQRRDLREQREIARALGLAGADLDDPVVIQQLLEAQARAENELGPQ
jgi:Uncharacterized conserved domain (SAYSvFN)